MYIASDEVIPNPERGWLKAEDSIDTRPQAANRDYASLGDQDLPAVLGTEDYSDKGITLVRRLFYLHEFLQTDITQAFLNSVDADFDTLRESGLKAVVRFAYSWDPARVVEDGEEIDRDATEAQILRHIAQLAPILQNNADVIALLEAGFIGSWGEWYYSDNFSDEVQGERDLLYPVNDAQYRARGDVLAALQAALPNRFILLRTPLFKERLGDIDYGNDPAPNMDWVGHVNDCFLKDATDSGTYTAALSVANPETNAQYAELIEDTLDVPMGGETCGESEEAIASQRTSCTSALRQLAQLHWSYLNADHSEVVLDDWDDCRYAITTRLGYRLSLVTSEIERMENAGGLLSYAFELTNSGFAAPIYPRGVELVLRGIHGSGVPVRLPLEGVDPTRWTSATEENPTHRMAGNVALGDLAPGVYEVWLNLPDPSPSLGANPSYSIQLANQGVWDGATGWNALGHQVSVVDADGRMTVSAAPRQGADQVTYEASASITFLPGFDSQGKSLAAFVR
ncbi:MAG: DUF4832 domain-containing protein [Acidobacteriota bacterium]